MKFLTGLFVVLLIMAGGCSSTDEHVATVQTVLEHQFNGPDEKLLSLVQNPENFTIIGDTDKENNQNGTNDLEKYLKDIYKPYFTDHMYQTFTRAFAMNYQMAAGLNKYNIMIQDLTITQNEMNEAAYDFSVNVAYEGNGRQGVEEVTGKAHINDDGKIAKIQYDENNLLKILESE